jgi:hypothetical protein
MKIEDITQQWSEDCVIDRNNLTLETLRTPNLHQKYLELLMQCKQKLIKYSSDYDSMKELRSRYYQGILSKEELEDYGWAQYQGLKPLKSDMQSKLDGDTELQRIRLKVQYIEAMIYQIESILHQIKGRDWVIKNHITWQMFQAGG